MTSTSAGTLAGKWKQIQLPSLQKELDTVAADLAERQDTSETGRKQLVQLSKEFKQTTSEDVRKQVTPLLKSFQSEIDSLNKRSKAAEAAFLNLYKKIIEIPDPSGALENASVWQKKAQKAVDLEMECGKLRETLDQYNQEFAEVKNQEVTIRQLKEKVKKLEEGMDTMVEERTKEKEDSISAQLNAKEERMQEENDKLKSLVDDANAKASNLQKSLSMAEEELSRLRARVEDSSQANSSQMDMLINDAERANIRAESAERELQLLKEQMEQMKEQSKGGSQNGEDDDEKDNEKSAMIEAELAAKDKQLSMMIEEISQLKSDLEKERKEFRTKEEKLDEELKSKEKELKVSEDKLKSVSDYSEIKQELSTLKSIEFGEDVMKGENEEEKSGGAKQSLEHLLLEKNKALQAELTSLKLTNQQLQKSAAAAVIGGDGSDGNAGVGSGGVGGLMPASMINAFGCLLGAELVNHQYADNTNDANHPQSSSQQSSSSPSSSSFNKNDDNDDQDGGDGVNDNNGSPNQHNNNNNNNSKILSSSSPSSPPPLASNSKLRRLPATKPLNANAANASMYNVNSFNNMGGGGMIDMAMAQSLLHLIRSQQQQQDLHRNNNNNLSPTASAAFLNNNNSDDTPSLNPPPPPQQPQQQPQQPQSFLMAAVNKRDPDENLQAELSKHGLPDYEQMINDGAERSQAENIIVNQLQSIVGANVEKLGDSSLNTCQVASECRQLLLLYNLGQRLFAKTILNQSQGSLSELLSKPRPWQRLTEKGREAFRKIHGWVSDERAILLLRSLSPRRPNPAAGQSQSGMNRNGSSHVGLLDFNNPISFGNGNNNVIESSISPSDAASSNNNNNNTGGMIEPKMEMNDDSSPSSTNVSPGKSASSNGGGGNNRWRHDDIPKEMVFQIYQRELAKLKEQEKSLQEELKGRQSSPKGRSSSSSQQQNDNQNLNSIGHKEQQQSQRSLNRSIMNIRKGMMTANINDQNIGAVSLFNNGGSPIMASVNNNNNNANNINNNSNLSASIFPQMINNNNNNSNNNNNGGNIPSPVQQHPQTLLITNNNHHNIPNNNNNNNNNNSNNGGNSRNRGGLKAILPPITQEQVELYGTLCTEDLVSEIKDFLSSQSISQRLFGEHVLGLSQGSVSDLLARPKPWHMLTQKGREPFIRMKLFLADPSAVEMLRNKKLAAANAASSNLQNNNGLNKSDSMGNIRSSNASSPSSSPALNSSNYVPILPKSDLSALLDAYSNSNNTIKNSNNINPNIHQHQQHPPLSRKSSHSSNDHREQVQDLDTHSVAEQVKALLHANSIGQKLFGEAVLGVSQGTVSELLSKPKPWSLLSLRGREPYIRMNNWLQDDERVEKLQEFVMVKNANKQNGGGSVGLGKRPSSSIGSHTSGTGIDTNLSASMFSNNSSSGGSEQGSFDLSALFGGGPGSSSAAKKARSLITDEQKEALRFAFHHEPYPSSKTVEFLAKELSLSVRTVVNWFHNHRMRVKAEPHIHQQQQQQQTSNHHQHTPVMSSLAAAGRAGTAAASSTNQTNTSGSASPPHLSDEGGDVDDDDDDDDGNQSSSQLIINDDDAGVDDDDDDDEQSNNFNNSNHYGQHQFKSNNDNNEGSGGRRNLWKEGLMDLINVLGEGSGGNLGSSSSSSTMGSSRPTPSSSQQHPQTLLHVSTTSNVPPPVVVPHVNRRKKSIKDLENTLGLRAAQAANAL